MQDEAFFLLTFLFISKGIIHGFWQWYIYQVWCWVRLYCIKVDGGPWWRYVLLLVLHLKVWRLLNKAFYVCCHILWHHYHKKKLSSDNILNLIKVIYLDRIGFLFLIKSTLMNRTYAGSLCGASKRVIDFFITLKCCVWKAKCQQIGIEREYFLV